MSRRFRTWTRVLWATSAAATLLLLLVFGFLLAHYPYQLITTDFIATTRKTFMSDWPMSPLAEEMHARKKKRYPRAELERIYLRDLRRMEFLNVPILDPFVSGSIKMTEFDSATQENLFPEYPWPWLETDRALGTSKSARKISYVLMPNRRGLKLEEGVLMSPGDELEFPAPISKLRRNLRFVVLPLNTGTMRVSSGQYSWARTFGDFETNHAQQITITMNDTASTVVKISAASSRLFLMTPKVTQAELSGRLPLQIGNENPFWQIDPALTKAMSVQEPEREPETTAGENEETAESEGGQETKPIDENVTATPVPAVPVETPAQLSEQKNDNLDSLTVTANAMIPVPGNRAVGLGYNLLLLQMGSSLQEILDDPSTFEKLAPRLSAFLGRSLVAKEALTLPQTNSRIFQETITGNGLAEIDLPKSILLRHALQRQGGFNLYRYLRDFGYHVMGIAPSAILGFPDDVVLPGDVPLYDAKWMDTNDWNLARRRIKIDRDAQPLKGLEAIFQGKDAPIPQPLVTSDYAEMAGYLQKVDEARGVFPDWQANELFMPDSRESYLATVVDHLQKWTNENRQIRFFAHVLFGLDDTSERASLKDLLYSLKGRKKMRLGHDLASQRLARIVLLDRAFGQLEDLLRVRRSTHRTVVALIIPDATSDAATRQGTLVLGIPGPIPKKVSFEKPLSLDNVIAELLTTLGIPLEFIGENFTIKAPSQTITTLFSPSSIVPPAPSVAPVAVPSQKYSVDRFSMLIRPAKKGCAWFAWRANSSIFGIESSEPVVEMAQGGAELRIFPCSVKTREIMIRWYQPVTEPPLDLVSPTEILDHNLGGTIFLSPLSLAAQGLPSFFFGKRFLPLGSFNLAQSNPSSNEIRKLFLLNSDEQPDILSSNLGLAQTALELGATAAERSTAILFSRRTAAREK